MPDSNIEHHDRLPKRRQRTISALNHEQLQHKRDLDRKAQRALRQRTKSRIEDLEHEVEQLKLSHIAQEAKLREHVQALQEQNRRLVLRLDRIGRLAVTPDPIVLEDEDHITMDFTPAAASPDLRSSEESTESDEVYPQKSRRNALRRSRNPGLATSRQSDEHSLHHYHRNVSVATKTPSGPPLTPGIAGHQVYGNSGGSQASPNDTIGASTGNKEPDHYLDGRAFSRPGRANNSSNITTDISPGNSNSHSSPFSAWTASAGEEVHVVLCKHFPPTCPLDQILLDFLSSRRALLAEGVPMASLLGPVQPIISAMIHPDRAPLTHPLSRVMSEILSTFGHVRLHERLAFMFLMYSTMRWQISPTHENYTRLPTWLRPTAKQITTRHAAWIDNIPWPGVRDLLIAYPEKYPFVVFSEMYSHNVSINWPYDPMDSVTRSQTDESEEVLNPIFEKHIRRLCNWKVSREFENCYPEMSAAIFARD